MATNTPAGRPFKVTSLGRTTSHTTLRNAKIKVGQLHAAGRTDATLRYYDPARGTVTITAADGVLGWVAVETVGTPFERAVADAIANPLPQADR